MKGGGSKSVSKTKHKSSKTNSNRGICDDSVPILLFDDHLLEKVIYSMPVSESRGENLFNLWQTSPSLLLRLLAHHPTVAVTNASKPVDQIAWLSTRRSDALRAALEKNLPPWGGLAFEATLDKLRGLEPVGPLILGLSLTMLPMEDSGRVHLDTLAPRLQTLAIRDCRGGPFKHRVRSILSSIPTTLKRLRLDVPPSTAATLEAVAGADSCRHLKSISFTRVGDGPDIALFNQLSTITGLQALTVTMDDAEPTSDLGVHGLASLSGLTALTSLSVSILHHDGQCSLSGMPADAIDALSSTGEPTPFLTNLTAARLTFLHPSPASLRHLEGLGGGSLRRLSIELIRGVRHHDPMNVDAGPCLAFLAAHTNLVHLDASGAMPSDSDVAARLPKLKSLCFQTCPAAYQFGATFPQPSALERLLSNDLRYLSADNVDLSDLSWVKVLAGMPRLSDLHVSATGVAVAPEVIAQIGASPSLREVTLVNSGNIPLASLTAALAANADGAGKPVASRLRSFGLGSAELPAMEVSAVLRQLTGLTSLCLNGLTLKEGDSEAWVDAMPSLPLLRCLHLHRMIGPVEPTLSSLLQQGKARRLESLLYDGARVPSGLVRAVAKAPSIRRIGLDLGAGTDLSSTHLLDILTESPHLNRIEVSGSSEVAVDLCGCLAGRHVTVHHRNLDVLRLRMEQIEGERAAAQRSLAEGCGGGTGVRTRGQAAAAARGTAGMPGNPRGGQGRTRARAHPKFEVFTPCELSEELGALPPQERKWECDETRERAGHDHHGEGGPVYLHLVEPSARSGCGWVGYHEHLSHPAASD